MTSNALKNEGKLVKPNIACAHSQENTKDLIFRLAKGTLCCALRCYVISGWFNKPVVDTSVLLS